jgi:hypothetical protein
MGKGFDILKYAADSAAQQFARDRPLADAIDDIAQELAQAADKAHEQLKALGFTDSETERELAYILAELLAEIDDGDDKDDK